MNILVIGGTRFIGRRTVEMLVAEGHRVALFNRGRAPGGQPDGVEVILGDRNQLADHRDAFAAFGPEVVLDMMAYADWQGEQLVEVFGGLCQRLVLVSSCDVYHAYGLLNGSDSGGPAESPVTEDSPLRQNLYPYRKPETPDSEWVYSYDKIPIEQAVLGTDRFGGCVLRLPMVYGDGDYQRRLYPYIKRIDDGRPHIVLDERHARWTVSMGYVGNVAEALVAAVTDARSAGRTYNVADEPAVTGAGWVAAIGEALGWRGRIVVAPSDRLPEALRFGVPIAQDLAVDTTRLRSELGWSESTGMRDAILATAAWDRANPPDSAPTFDYDAEDAAVAALEG